MRRLSTIGTLLTASLFAGGGSLGCASTWNLYQRWFGGDLGVPLTDFKATDGDYFPPFVMKFFRGAALFAQSAPTMVQAREGMVLIEVKQLSDRDLPNNEANLSWSADGAWLAFEVISDRERQIKVKNIVGDYERELSVQPARANTFLEGMVVGSAHSYNAGLRWSRDTTRYAFMSNGGTGFYNIYVGAIGAGERPITRGSTKDGYATWSPVTNEIAFVSGRTGNGDIYLIDVGSNDLTRLSDDEEAVDLFPEWASDGNSIVYSSGDAMAHSLYVVRRGSGGRWGDPARMTEWDNDDLRPTISPDGRWVAFYSSSPEEGDDGSPVWNIHVVRYEPGKLYTARELSAAVVARRVVIDLNTGPAWTPDGRKILFVKHDPDEFNPIYGYDVFSGQSFVFRTKTRMNRDITMSRLGVLSFRAQVGVWDRVFVALTNQGLQLQKP